MDYFVAPLLTITQDKATLDCHEVTPTSCNDAVAHFTIVDKVKNPKHTQ